MAENRAFILPGDLVDKLDANRSDMSRSEFVKFLLDHLLGDGGVKDATNGYVTREELQEFERDMRSLLRSFLDFFLTYGLELGPAPKKDDLHAQALKLRSAVGLPENGEAFSPD